MASVRYSFASEDLFSSFHTPYERVRVGQVRRNETHYRLAQLFVGKRRFCFCQVLQSQQKPGENIDRDGFLALSFRLFQTVGEVRNELALVFGGTVRENVAKKHNGRVDDADT